MSKGRSGGGEERKPKRETVRLRVAREEAASLLKGCLDEMKEHYLPDVVLMSFPEPIKTKTQTWTRKCEAILSRIFGEGQVVDDFVETGTPFFSREDFIKRYRNLLGLQESLPYYEVATAPLPVERPSYSTTKVFIVHGHAPLRHEVELFLTKIGLTPIILEEQASKGKTVIEKLEHYADVGFAVVLLTPDDVGGKLAEHHTKQTLNPRARQNVILELGYFVGKLGRDRVCALKKGELEEPGDFENVVYVSYDDGNWGIKLVKELEAAKMAVNRAGM
ncbi:MAG: nucleotide-binding protein [Planctomycetia bacterium]|nr:nucleotide-binding protein [Planctomycetia bacterium]